VACSTFFLSFYLVHGGEADSADGHTFGLWEVGTTCYTAIVVGRCRVTLNPRP